MIIPELFGNIAAVCTTALILLIGAFFSVKGSADVPEEPEQEHYPNEGHDFP